MLSKFLKLIFALFYLLPIFILVYFSKNISTVGVNYLYSVIISSFNQAILGTTAVVILSLVVAPICAGLSVQIRRYIELILILPTFMPALFVVLGLLKLISPFPFGLLGISLGYFFTYFGYGVVVLTRAYDTKIKPFEAIKSIYNISSFNFFKSIYLPLIKNQVLQLFGVVFLSCMTSLTIPMVLGGNQADNLELFIYQNLSHPEFSLSVILIYLLQMTIYFLFLKMMTSSVENFRHTQLRISRNLKNPLNFLFFVPFMYIATIFTFVFLVFGYLYRHHEFIIENKSILLEKSIYSGFLSLGIWIAFCIIMIGYTYIYWKKNKNHFIYYLIAPSAAVVCYSYFLVFPLVSNKELEYFKLLLVVSTLMFPFYFKNFFLDKLDAYKKQITIAKVYNLSFMATLKNILWPGFQKEMYIVGLLILLTCTFDFALFKAAHVQNNYIATYLYDFISGYRLELAYAISGFSILFITLIIVILRWTYVIIKKYTI